MNNRLVIFLLFLAASCSFSYVQAESNQFIGLFRDFFPDTYMNVELKNLRAFIGDTIFIEIQGNDPIKTVFKETPDTVWLKDKPSKMPKEGKDFLICHNYRGFRQGNSFITPIDSLSKESFKVMDVNELYKGFIPNGYEIALMDVATSELVNLVLENGVSNEWRILSKKANDTIGSWKNTMVYIKNKYGSGIDKYLISNGELYLSVKSAAGKLSLKPYAKFVLTCEDKDSITVIYDSNSYRPSSLANKMVLSDADYEREREFEINYELPLDTLYKNKLRHLPFPVVMGRILSSSTKIYQKIGGDYSSNSVKSLDSETPIFIGDRVSIRGNAYYKAALYGKSFFVECDNVALDEIEDLNILLAEPQEIRDAFFESAKVMSLNKYYQDRSINLKRKAQALKRGIVVTVARPFDMSAYTDGTGMKFAVINTSDNIIKYVTFNFSGYNAVDDVVSSRGQTVLSRRGIGPIDFMNSAMYEFDYVWFTDVVKYSKLHSILVEYNNGVSKTFTGKALEIIPLEVINEAGYGSPLEEFLPKLDYEEPVIE